MNQAEKQSIVISQASESIIAKITKPIKLRANVCYNHEFLDAYQPNKTFYLPEKNRKTLHNIGTTLRSYQRVYPNFVVDLSWNSSRLEDNSYSYSEANELIIQNNPASDKTSFETQMLLNHKDAIDFLTTNIETVTFNAYTIRNLHALLAYNLLPSTACGKLRNIPVSIGGTPYRPLSVPQAIESRFNQILTKASEIQDPFEQAFFAFVHLPYLLPFEDVNKRTSRLAVNIPLIKNTLMPLSFIDMPADLYTHAILGIYELNQIELLRDVFIWNYRRSAESYSAAA